MSYTKDITTQAIPSILNIEDNTLKLTFRVKCNIFRTTLFPKPPKVDNSLNTSLDFKDYNPNLGWEWPILSRVELYNACSVKIKGKSPGIDLITQEIIIRAYSTIPDIFFIVFSLLINSGYYPKVWKQATGFILKKPKKPDYTILKAYRVISLLNCLGKVSERILARRLSYLAKTTYLLHPI